MSDTDFALIYSHHMYTRQVAPGLFVPPATGTGPQIAAAQDVHDKALRLFNECTMVEKILIAQMHNAINPKYFKEQLHATTNIKYSKRKYTKTRPMSHARHSQMETQATLD